MYWGRVHIYLLAALAGGGLQEAWRLGTPDRGHSKGPGRQDFAQLKILLTGHLETHMPDPQPRGPQSSSPARGHARRSTLPAHRVYFEPLLHAVRNCK